MERKIFTCKSTQDTFNSWMQIGGGINPNTSDVERFYAFVSKYFENGEYISKEVFVKECKRYTHCTRIVNRGVCQKYYYKIETIVDFLKYQSKVK